MTVKPSRLFLFLALSAPVAALSLRADDGVLPKSPPVARYDAMAARSPFTAPTAAVTATPTPVQAGPHWWDQMFLTSLMERSGVYYIGMVDKASNKHYLLETGKADEDSQLLLTEVHWNDRLDQTTAIVSKGAETAPAIRFDASAATAAPASAPFAPGQQPFTAPRPISGMQPPALPPGFTGTPPPPPPSTGSPVVRRIAPIASRPGATSQNPPRSSAQPPGNGPRRIIVPNGDEN